MINKDFFQALEDLEREKNIKKEFFIESLEAALTSAYQKQFGEKKSATVKLFPEKCTIKIYSYKTVVENVEDNDKEISLADAKAIKKSHVVGDCIMQEETTKDFGRIAAQTAKQVVMQKLREVEKTQSLNALQDKEGELLTGIVRRIEKGTVYLDMGGVYAEGVMSERDQIPSERFNIGDRIKVYVRKVVDNFKGTQVQVSRTNANFVRKLFELEVPEIATGEVEIVNIVREAGYRTKVAIKAANEDLDPIGACVGNKGIRINTIVSEINGEKIDIIEFSDNIMQFIANSLSPAKVLSVEIDEEAKTSLVIVPDDKLSLAIGKEGQNVRLAAKLSGWKIDVKSETTAKTLKAKNNVNINSNFSDNDILGDIEEI